MWFPRMTSRVKTSGTSCGVVWLKAAHRKSKRLSRSGQLDKPSNTLHALSFMYKFYDFLTQWLHFKGSGVCGDIARASTICVPSCMEIRAWEELASRTLRSLPRSGKTPYSSRPMTLRPLMARAFAESPSVRISVHLSEPRPPALLASSSFGIPVRTKQFLSLE
jgi:hypothetical protein